VRDPLLRPEALNGLPGDPEAAGFIPASAQLRADAADLAGDEPDARTVEAASQIERSGFAPFNLGAFAEVMEKLIAIAGVKQAWVVKRRKWHII
jgi:hypothetical protein